MMSIVFDCLKTVAGMKSELGRMTARGNINNRKLKDIQNHLIRDSLWMGEHGEESEFWITACMLHLSEYATETIRQRFVRDRDEVLAILAGIEQQKVTRYGFPER